MGDDDVTSDGLPRFIYGEYTGEMALPERPEADEDDAEPAMTRQTMALLASGGLALLLIIGLVVAALSTGGDEKPAALKQSSGPSGSASPAGAPSPTGSPEPSPTWTTAPPDPITVTTTGAKTPKPATSKAKPPSTKPTTPKASITVRPPRISPHV